MRRYRALLQNESLDINTFIDFFAHGLSDALEYLGDLDHLLRHFGSQIDFEDCAISVRPLTTESEN